jgi:mannosyltransferase
MAVVWVMRSMFGSSEVVLRLPSLAAMLAAAYCLYRLGRDLFDGETGLSAAGIFLLFPQIEFAAADARPYAYAVLAAIGALSMLVRWLDRGRAGDAFAYVILAAATVYLHYLFATALVAHAAYALRRRRGGSPVSLRQLLVGAAGLGLLLLPAARLVLEIGRRRSSHAFVEAAEWKGFGQVLIPGRVLGVLVPSLLLCLLLRVVTGLRVAPLRRGRADALFLLGLAALVPAVLLFPISRLSGTNLLVVRYLMGAVPAQALLLGWLLGVAQPARGRRAVLGCSLALVIALRGGVRSPEAHGREDWRSAVSALNAVNADGPVFLGGSFIEARDIGLVRDPAHAAYLRAPLDVYPTRGAVVVLPLRSGPAAESYVGDILAAAPPGERFALIERNSSFPSWEPWLEQRFREAGYATKDVWKSPALKVRVFRRTRP